MEISYRKTPLPMTDFARAPRADRLVESTLLLAVPLMLTATFSETLAPNEEPKWALWMLAMSIISISQLTKRLRAPDTPPERAEQTFTLEGFALLLFATGLALGVTQSINPTEAFNRLAYWGLGLLTVPLTARLSRLHPAFEHRLGASVVLGSSLLAAFFWKAYFLDYETPGFNRFVQFSRIGHFNFTADALMVLIPLNGWALLLKGPPFLRALALFSTLSLLFMLGTGGSLGGMGGLSLGALAVVPLALRHRLNDRIRLRARPLIFLVGLLFMLSLAIPALLEQLPNDLRQQMFSRAGWTHIPTRSELETTEPEPPFASLWVALAPLIGARTPMWASTAGMVADRPLTGHGTGSFLFVYPEYSKRFPLFQDFETLGVKVKTNPHNVLLQIAADNGLPMMLLFILLYVSTLIQTVRRGLHSRDPFWAMALWALIAGGLDAGVNHVFFNPSSLFMMALLLGLIHGRLQTTVLLTRPSFPPDTLKFASLAATLGVIALFWNPARFLISEHLAAKAIALEMARPSPSPVRILTAWESALSWSPSNLQALFGLANARFRAGQTAQAEETLKALLNVAPAHTASLNLLATLEARSGELKAARTHLQKALALEPDATTLRENLDLIERSLPPDGGPL